MRVVEQKWLKRCMDIATAVFELHPVRCRAAAHVFTRAIALLLTALKRKRLRMPRMYLPT
jgi:hypothetical protein